MSRRPRWNHTPALKAKVALAAIKGDRALAQLSEQFDVHPNQIRSWKAQLEGGAVDVFGSRSSGRAPSTPAVDVKSLHAKIGEHKSTAYMPTIVGEAMTTVDIALAHLGPQGAASENKIGSAEIALMEDVATALSIPPIFRV